jgi:arylsulfatase
MKKILALLSFCLFCSIFGDDRPNIIVILSDDMGYSDIGCYGSEVATPNLDQLAEGGLLFTQFYNTGRCCPTRGSLLTGLYPHQSGIGHMTGDYGSDGYRGDLSRNAVTIAEVLKMAGYSTYISGKWHVTPHIKPEGPKYNWPLQRGFERFYGTILGAGSFFDPVSLTRDNQQISPVADESYQPEQYYYTDAISDHAVKFIEQHQQRDSHKPFFLYMAYTAAHWPMHALEKDIAKYKGKYDQGYESIRNARFEKMKELGVIDPSWTLSPIAETWESQEHKAWDARNMEVYAAMIDNMDQGIGRMIQSLKKTGEFENTLILFMQDNGGCAEGLGRSAGKKHKDRLSPKPSKPDFAPMPKETLQKDMIPHQSRDGYLTRMGPENMAGPDGTYIAYGKGWANVSNAPFREYKHYVHEGGISTPLIAHWPKSIKDKGKLRHTPSHLIDIMATCVDLGQATYPQTYQTHNIIPMEGKSLQSIFQNDSLDRAHILWEHEGHRAIRKADWKLVMKKSIGKWELYNLKTDRTEMLDQSEQHPEKFKELVALWESEADRTLITPQPAKFLPKK